MDSPILEVQDLIKQFRQSDSVVTAVNRAKLSVESGEFIAIVGTSGSGKSTFLQLCAGLMVPNSGSIKILGQDITRLSPDELATFRGRYLGMIFQKHNLIPQLTAKENIELPAIMMDKAPSSYEHSFAKLVELLKIKDRLHHLPSELSGGQQQRVAIARALMNRPQILFADEPTGNLDRANADEVLALLLKMQKDFNQTLIMVTHDESIARRADRIFRMEDGILSQTSL